MCICLSPFSFEEIEAQKRPRTPELGFAPRPAHPHTCVCPRHPATPPVRQPQLAPGPEATPAAYPVSYPGSQLPRQTQSQAAPMCGPPSKCMALLSRWETHQGGDSRSGTCTNRGPPVTQRGRHAARGRGPSCEGLPSPSLLRSFSCRHNALKTSGPTLGPVCNSP